MAELSVTNILRLQNFDCEISPGVTLVHGINSAGKTSFARILGALTAQHNNPARLSAAERKCYIYRRGSEGEAQLQAGDHFIAWSPGTGITAEEGAKPLAVPQAVGIIDFTKLPRNASDRAEVWEPLFVPADPEKLLKPVWPLSQRQLTTVLERIRTRGWKSAQGIYEDQRKEAKRDWETATGKRYGIRVAATWLPAGWRPDLEGFSRGDLLGAWERAREELDAAKMVHAVDATKIAEAKRVRDEEIPRLQAQVKLLNDQTDKLRGKVVEKTTAMTALVEQGKKLQGTVDRCGVRLEAEAPLGCPACGVGMILRDRPDGQYLEEWTPLAKEAKDMLHTQISDADAALQKTRKDYAVLDGEQAAIRVEYDKTRAAFYAAQGELTHAQNAARLADAQETPEVDAAERSRLEQTSDKAKEDLDMWDNWNGARRAVESITEYDSILELLGPNGPRAKLLQKGIRGIQQMFKRVEDVTGWLPIRLQKDYNITSDDWPVPLVADNEKVKVQWVCQIACALLSGSKWIVLDKADLLRGAAWDGLVRMLGTISAAHPHLHIVLCATEGVDINESWNIIEIAR